MLHIQLFVSTSVFSKRFIFEYFQNLHYYADYLPALRFYLSVNSKLDTDSVGAPNDFQLAAVSMDGSELFKSTEIGDVTFRPDRTYRSSKRRGLIVVMHITLDVKKFIDLKYCGKIHFITQLDVHDLSDYDIDNNLIANEVNLDKVVSACWVLRVYFIV